MPSYDVGDKIRLTAEFRDLAGEPVDPDSVTCTIRAPSGLDTVLTYAGGGVARASAGSFYAEAPVAEAGVWHVRWHSTGAAQAAEETSFTVRASWFQGA